MEFLSKLKVEHADYFDLPNLHCEGIPTGTRACSWIYFNEDYALSIQASGMHYCIPRGMVALDQYSAFELATIYKGKLIDPQIVLEGFERAGELDYGDTVLPFVAKDLVNDIYLFMKEKYGDGEVWWVTRT